MENKQESLRCELAKICFAIGCICLLATWAGFQSAAAGVLIFIPISMFLFVWWATSTALNISQKKDCRYENKTEKYKFSDER